MRATLVLCDYAKVSDGKLDLMGGGWCFAGPDPVSFGVGMILEVPWTETNRPHRFTLRLLDEDGNPVNLNGPDSPPAYLELSDVFEVGRPAGHPEGAPIPLAMALNASAVPLPPGRRFQWRLEIDGESDDNWYLSFQTRPAGP